MGCTLARMRIRTVAGVLLIVLRVPLFAQSDEERNRAAITISRMQQVAAAIHAYMTDFDSAPSGNEVEDLRAGLTPAYMRELPSRDGWDTPLRYSKTGTDSFQIISAGADRTFDQKSWSTPARLDSLRDDAVLTVKNRSDEGALTRVWVDESGTQIGEASAAVKVITQSVVNAEVRKMQSLPADRQETYFRTMTTEQWMTATAAAIKLYQVKSGSYPEAKSIGDLEKVLVPSLVSEIFTHDSWGDDFRYVRSPDGKSYTLVSAGADGVFDETTWQRRANDLASANDDAVIRNGGFVRSWGDSTRAGDTREMRERRQFKAAAQPLLAHADQRGAAHDYAGALDAYMKAVDSDPRVATLDRLRQYAPPVQYSVGDANKPSPAEEAAREKGEKKEIAALRQYVKLHAEDRKAFEDLMFRLPAAEAEAMVNREIEAHPRDLEWARTRATLIAKQGDAARTIDAYQEVIDLDPANAETHYILGVVLYEKVAKDAKLTAAAKRPLIERGLKALERAQELKAGYFEAMAYHNLLLRQEATIETDPERQKKLLAEADAERQRAIDVMKRRHAAP
jgi:hypothetical protein